MGHDKLNPGREMPFGKYEGWALDEIPDSYLRWLIEQDWFEEKFEDLFEEVEAELAWRDEVNEHIR